MDGQVADDGDAWRVDKSFQCDCRLLAETDKDIDRGRRGV